MTKKNEKYYCLKDDPTKELYTIYSQFNMCITLFSPRKHEFEIIETEDLIEPAQEYLIVAARLKGDLDNEGIDKIIFDMKLQEASNEFAMEQARRKWEIENRFLDDSFKQLIAKGFNV